MGGLLTSKAERNIWGHCDLNNIININEKGDFVENLRVLINEWKF